MLKVKSDIKKIKADRLISITSVKEENENTLFYHFSLDKKSDTTEFSIKVPKGEEVESIVDIYEIATLLEAEITELFDIKFNGNAMSGMRLFHADGKKRPKTCSVKGSFRVTKNA